MTLKNKLYNIESELKNIPSREITFESCIKTRLSQSIDVHSQHVKRICDYLKYRDSVKVLRTIKEYNKKKSKRKSDGKIN